MSNNDFSIVSVANWDSQWDEAVKMLAMGHSIKEAAEAVGVTERTIYNWKNKPQFEAEMDRLSLIYGLASKAERTRMLMRMARQKIKDDGTIELDDTSMMDILKEMRMQIEGTRIDITQLYSALSDEARSVARSGQVGNDAIDAAESDSTE
jgi:transposase